MTSGTPSNRFPRLRDGGSRDTDLGRRSRRRLRVSGNVRFSLVSALSGALERTSVRLAAENQSHDSDQQETELKHETYSFATGDIELDPFQPGTAHFMMPMPRECVPLA